MVKFIGSYRSFFIHLANPKNRMGKFRNFISVLGPGLLYAGAAIGVSHLVQSTRAGAEYEFDLIWVLILANVIKYPFFEFGPRYASATGNSLIEGYRQIGNWAINLFTLLTLLTMFAIQGAVTMVTAGIALHLFNSSLNITQVSAIILGTTMIVLMIGRYAILDRLIKIVIVVLATSTIIAVISAFGSPAVRIEDAARGFDWGFRPDIIFLIAFVGWMPAPVDVTVWQSLWTVAKSRTMKFRPSLSQTLLDFKTGYIGTAFLALAFLLLGALVMYGTGESLSPSGGEFARQLITMYTESIGEWSYFIIGIAALTTMYSTTLTVIDAYPRVLRPLTEHYFPGIAAKPGTGRLIYWFWILLIVSGTLIFIGYLTSSMRFMVDLATTLSFITAPLLAFLNYRVVTDKHMPEEGKPATWLRAYAWTGIIFLTAFTLFYIVWRLFL